MYGNSRFLLTFFVLWICYCWKELNSAIAPSERRLFAINETIREIDHEDEFRHDEEIKCSADIILFQKLALALAIDCSSEEVPLICNALEMIYRASRVAISASFDQIGMSVVPLIMEIIQRPPQHNLTDRNEDVGTGASGLNGTDDIQYGWGSENVGDSYYEQNSSYVDQPDPILQPPNQAPPPQQPLPTTAQPQPQPPLSHPRLLLNSAPDMNNNPSQYNQNEAKAGDMENGNMPSSYIDCNNDDADYDSQNYHSNYGGYSMEADPKIPTPVKVDKDEGLSNLSQNQEGQYPPSVTPLNSVQSSNHMLDPIDPDLDPIDPIDPNKSISPSSNDSDLSVPREYNVEQADDDEEEKMMDVDLISRFNEGIEEDKRNVPTPPIVPTSPPEDNLESPQQQRLMPSSTDPMHTSNTPDVSNVETTHLEETFAQMQMDEMPNVNNNDQSLHHHEQVPTDSYSYEKGSSYQPSDQYQDEYQDGYKDEYQDGYQDEYQDQFNSYAHPDETEKEDLNVLSGMNPLPIDITDSLGPSETAMNKILKVLRYYSRILNAMVPLCSYPGLIDAILYQIQRCSISDTFKNTERTEARIDAIAIIVNLACAENNKFYLVEEPNLLRTVIQLARTDSIEKVREHATIVLLNLSYAEENKVKLAQEDGLLSTLAELLCDSSSYTRRYAAASLFTLAGDVKNSELIATHEKGLVLEALRILLLKEPSEAARISAAEAIFIMTRSNSELAVMAIAHHPRFLDTLAEAVVNEVNHDVRLFAARSLEWLSSDVHYPSQCHAELLGALVKASQWTETSSIAEAMKTQATVKENRVVMVRHPGLLGALAGLSLLTKSADSQTKSYAISAIERLSTEPANMDIMAKNSLIMTALTRANFSGSYDDQQQGDDYMNSNSYLLKAALKNLAGYM